MRKVKNQTVAIKNLIKPKSKPNTSVLKGHKRSKSDHVGTLKKQVPQQSKQFFIDIDQDILFTFSNDPEVKQKIKISKPVQPLETPRIGSVNSLQSNPPQKENVKGKIYPHQKYKQIVKQQQIIPKRGNLLDHYNKIMSIVKKFEEQADTNKLSLIDDQYQEKTVQKNRQDKSKNGTNFQQNEFPSTLICQDQDQESLRHRKTVTTSTIFKDLLINNLCKVTQKGLFQEEAQNKCFLEQKTDVSREIKAIDDEKTVKRQSKSFKFTNNKISMIISDFNSTQLEPKYQTVDHKLRTQIKRRMLYDPETRPFIEPFKMKVGLEDTLNKRRRQIRSNF